ncbi:MAG TPA: radical SAM family heme chaperone HemW [Vicinamibacterales bacterium]|jgi:oxygen-independent coproporphyrinogen-3 oxidase|nr:radical SAM family heme chaperone HemW [Vicinamibacterales bacterium]
MRDRGLLGLYIHIPFCSSICNYCNFNRGLFDAAVKDRYVRALTAEIVRTGAGDAADTVFFGGGTPSLLEPDEIGGLIASCRGAFDLPPDAEITLETNPETVTRERLERFRAAGVNRISFGVQSFRDEELRRLGRIHSADRARRAVTAAREAGFDNISLDLMMWLPQQSTAQWQESVDGLIDVSPEHASLYLLELYPNAPLREDMARAGWSLAPDDDAAEMYLWSMARLEEAGYRQYEISNVARPGRESRHNLKYWTDGEWAGFGCGAHSTRVAATGTVRSKNVSSTTEYIERIEGQAPVTVEVHPVAAHERLEDALFTGLRLAVGVDVHALGDACGVDVWARYGAQLQPFLDAGVLRREGGRLRLTRAGMLVANEIMSVFV